MRPISQLTSETPPPEVIRYAFRSFDRQWLLADQRIIGRPRPQLWHSSSAKQLFAVSTSSLGNGPAIVTTPQIPDFHFFNNLGGKDIIPLYRDAAVTEPNVTHGLLDLLNGTFGEMVTPEDVISYITGVLGHPGFTEHFHDELEVPGPRVPLTRDRILFRRAVEIGQQVIAWQTYAERFPKAIGTTQGQVPAGNARVLTDIPDDPDKYPDTLRDDVRYADKLRELHVGEGIFGDVAPEVWAYEDSGLRVVRSWLGYRMKDRAGRRSSPLDDIRPERWTWEMTRELQDLLWVLEGVIALEPAQDELLTEIIAGDLFLSSDLPTPTDAEREPPGVDRRQQLGFELGL